MYSMMQIFSALITQEDGLIPNIFDKMGVYATRRIEEVLVKAEAVAEKFKDSYISVEHVMLAIMDVDSKGAVGNLLTRLNIKKDNFCKFYHKLEGAKGLKLKTLKEHMMLCKNTEQT